MNGTSNNDHGNENGNHHPARSPYLSAEVMRQMSMLQCLGCLNCFPGGQYSDDQQALGKDDVLDYDIKALRRQNSAASPLVVAPMMNSSTAVVGTSQYQRQMESIIAEYVSTCRFYGCADRVNAGVLTTFRFSLPSLRVGGSFHDADMLALAEILLRHANGPLRYIKRLDFSVASKEGKLHGKAGFRSHGALALSKVLQMTQHIEEVYLQGNRISSYGASAIFLACAENPNVKRINMRRCQIGERGALAFAEIIIPSEECGLVEVDISANHIGFKGTLLVDRTLNERNQNSTLPSITVEMDGNLVFQEIMNGITHGLGIILAVYGSWLLMKRASGKSDHAFISCAVYSTSLITLYTSSTLYHSFFFMRGVRFIFEVMDKCAIYILISGSYTPFLQIVLAHEPIYSRYLLAFIWLCCVCGVSVEAFTNRRWKHRFSFSLAMYLGMGWCAVVCLPEVARILPRDAMLLIVCGGLSYTGGIPFFVRNNNLDHAIWHLFVLGGSAFHWFGTYYYVVTYEHNVDVPNTIRS